MVCGKRRIWDLAANRVAVELPGNYPVALWPFNLDPGCRTEPAFY